MTLSGIGPAGFDIKIMPVGVEKTPRVPQYGMSKTTGAAMSAVVVSAILRRRAEADFDAVFTSFAPTSRKLRQAPHFRFELGI